MSEEDDSEIVIDAQYRAWLDDLDERVIQGEFGYEPGEVTVYAESWFSLYKEGLSPDDAWRRALDAFAEERKEREAEERANYERICFEEGRQP